MTDNLLGNGILFVNYKLCPDLPIMVALVLGIGSWVLAFQPGPPLIYNWQFMTVNFGGGARVVSEVWCVCMWKPEDTLRLHSLWAIHCCFIVCLLFCCLFCCLLFCCLFVCFGVWVFWGRFSGWPRMFQGAKAAEQPAAVVHMCLPQHCGSAFLAFAAWVLRLGLGSHL